jgi:hypothetical protein
MPNWFRISLNLKIKGKAGIMDQQAKPAVRRRNWRRIHHSPLFWVGLFLCLSAITIYVLSEDLSWRPRLSALK